MTVNVTTESAILFDLDGTLLDTANDLGETLNYVLAQHEMPLVKRVDYRPVASDGALGLLQLGFKDELKHFDYQQLRAEFLQYYEEHIAQHTCFYPQIEALLNELNKRNIAWGVVTNKPEYLTRKLLPNFTAFDHCQVIVGGDTLPQRKPDPEPLLYACQQIKSDPSQSIYVGDALRDIEAGNSAHMTTIIAEWGYIKNKQDCKHWHSNFSCTSPMDILSIIKQSS